MKPKENLNLDIKEGIITAYKNYPDFDNTDYKYLATEGRSIPSPTT